MRFFVPGLNDDADPEAAYGALRAYLEDSLGRQFEDTRYYSLSYVHDGSEYVAVVGSPRKQTTYRRRRNGQPDYNSQPRVTGSGGVVQAIFKGTDDGAPFYIWEVPGTATPWAQPAMVGPGHVRAAKSFDAQG